jgi:predicted CXXCH cytochrome family protein
MKRLTLVLSAVAAFALTASASTPGIAGSAHDYTANSGWFISGNNWATGGRTNICSPCHTIHHTNPDKVAPLWTHMTTAQTFQTYASPTFNGTVTLNSAPGSTKACLSCHDGSVALNQTATGSTNGPAGSPLIYVPASFIIPDGGAAPGLPGNTDLTKMHPVGFSYASVASQDADIKAVTSPVLGVGANSLGVTLTVGNTMLKSGNMECASCHDIHRTKGNSMNSGIYTITSGQNLCLTCHNK